MMPYFEALGFHLAGYGCMTCIGNSGPLDPAIEAAISEKDLTVASVLSGNRNFEARIHQKIRGNYLASPMLVVAFALAGRVDIDLIQEPLGTDSGGNPVFLKEIFPTREEIDALVAAHVKPVFYGEEYAAIFDGDAFWQGLPAAESTTYAWDETSTYIRKPPYFDALSGESGRLKDITGGRVLALLGDSVTTDHISPAGAIPEHYPAGQYLIGRKVAKGDFNSYGSRRGNHEVMMRGTFGNIRIKNKLVGGKEGSWTLKFPEVDEVFIYEAAMTYREEKTPLIILGGREYGTGSSRDWAAKGTDLLGVRAVIAESFERIHRSNLVGMGVLPLTFQNDDSWESLGLDGSEIYEIKGISDIRPLKTLQISAARRDGVSVAFGVTARLNTEVDVAYVQNGGILPYVLRKLIG
jgi:aconitate hydratase